MTDSLEPIENDSLVPFFYETGTSIRSFNIIETKDHAEGYEIRLDIDLDSGYELEDVKMKITFDDLAAYETKDIHQGVRYALGFFHH
ncbi:hypothetical protein JMM81_14135 [Bacillus sp. V3B]|uniref:hypothetical protein n=1 Tax=Bacillus sp. V3B TaxID=2804915 RepID=UPI00210E2914|nr:hypothetical protein [Bacillus sp. V3B]MCQ6276071.1 hypothetical protein [Bacillus sp. V3B]